MCTKPKRNSFTRVGEKRCVSLAVKNRALQREIIGEVEIGGADAAGERAAEGSLEAACAEGKQRFRMEKKKRAETLSWPARNSRSQLVVNWSSVYFPGLLIMKVPVLPAAPGIVGIRNPPGLLPNWSLLKIQEGKHHWINVRARQWKTRSG